MNHFVNSEIDLDKKLCNSDVQIWMVYTRTLMREPVLLEICFPQLTALQMVCYMKEDL